MNILLKPNTFAPAFREFGIQGRIHSLEIYTHLGLFETRTSPFGIDGGSDTP